MIIRECISHGFSMCGSSGVRCLLVKVTPPWVPIPSNHQKDSILHGGFHGYHDTTWLTPFVQGYGKTLEFVTLNWEIILWFTHSQMFFTFQGYLDFLGKVYRYENIPRAA